MAGTIALITARGGSKGIPRKNLAELAGRPLIAHTLDAAAQAEAVDRIVLTTEDREIAEVGRAWGAEIIDRPAELATDGASSLDVIAHALDVLKDGPAVETLILLQPTSPLRTAPHVDDSFALFRSSGAASVISVTEAGHPPWKMFVLDADSGRLHPLMGAEYLSKPRQDLTPVYRPNGAIFIQDVATFRTHGSLFAEPAVAYVMDAESSIDIDSPMDLETAERILARRSV